MIEGVYYVKKQPGWTSFDVVAKIKSELREKTGQKVKIGHTGTLDPFAAGLLIILIGKATKLQNDYLKLDKEYEASLVLGQSSTTGDIEGEISPLRTPEKELAKIKIEDIQESFQRFLGPTSQVPPKFSAIKIDGERAYAKARRGEQVEMPEREIVIDRLEIISYQAPILNFRVSCSSGTYVRTLSEDIAKSLGTVGYLQNLLRTKIGRIDLAKASTIEETIEKIVSDN